MIIKKEIKRIAEPVVYLVLVASFGFIATLANHSKVETQIQDPELVSLTLEYQIESVFDKEETWISL